MGLFDWICAGAAVVGTIAVLIFAARTKHFFKTLLYSALAGFITMTVLYITAPLTGFRIEITMFSTLAAALFGVPGVLCMTIVKMIFGV